MERTLAKERLLVSACLMGDNVKYNGGNNKIDLSRLQEEYGLIPFCPEIEGGLPTPRAPSEIISKNPLKLVDINGKDVTKQFQTGAQKALELAQKLSIKKALLKSNSPSCSSSMIYDGTFSSTLIKGDGVTSALLKENGIEVFDENSI